MTLDDFIEFSQPIHSEEFQRLPSILKRICFVASLISWSEFNQKLKTTSVFRKKTTDSGIHEAYRAIDFKSLKEDAQTYRLIEIINGIYVYDPLRANIKVAHENPYHGTGKHIHLQVHANTTILTVEKYRALAEKARFDEIKFG